MSTSQCLPQGLYATYPPATAYAAPQGVQPEQIRRSSAKGPRFFIMHPQPLNAQPPQMPTTRFSDASSDLNGDVIEENVPPPVDLRMHFFRTAEDEAMLAAFGLTNFNCSDPRVWDGAAFDSWHTQRLAAAMLTPQDLYKSRRLLSCAHIDLGAHTGKFAPLAIRALVPANKQGMPWKFAWTSLCRKYATMGDLVWQHKSAGAIVKLQESWAVDAGRPLLALAWLCVETAQEHGEDRCRRVASLIEILAVRFAERKVLHAFVFLEVLKRCVWEEFEGWWQPGAYGLSSPPYRSSPAAHSAALAIVAFIGELFKSSVLQKHFIFRVMKLLILPMTTIEQVRAVRLLLSLCGDRLRETALGFVRVFNYNLSRVVTSYMHGPQGVHMDE